MVAAAQERPVGESATARVRMAGARRPPVPGRPLSPAAPPASVGGSRSSASLSLSAIWSSGPASVMLLQAQAGGRRMGESEVRRAMRGNAGAAGAASHDLSARSARCPRAPRVEHVEHAVQALVVGHLEAAQHDALGHVVQAHVPAAHVRGT